MTPAPARTGSPANLERIFPRIPRCKLQVRRVRTVLASAVALVVLAGPGAACSKGGSSTATSADPCEQIADDAVAAWQDFTSKHGSDLSATAEGAQDDFKALTEKIQTLQTQMQEKSCNPDQIGARIKEKAPDFLGADKQGATTAP